MSRVLRLIGLLRNGSGNLGDGTTTHRGTPVAVTGIANAIDLSVGYDHGCARSSDGLLRCWQWHQHSQHNPQGREQPRRGSPGACTGPVALGLLALCLLSILGLATLDPHTM